MKSKFLAAFAFIFMLAACGGENTGEAEDNQQEPLIQREQHESNNDGTKGEEASGTVSLEITGNDQMQFNKNRFEVRAGQNVELTLKHVGEMPENAMGHNWILLAKGVDKASFAEDAVQAKDNDYIPSNRSGDIIAHTEMIGGGESTTITFEAPAKGIYDFMCSFPGHYAVMNGKFIVR